jgi:hypothetical protein
VSVLFVLPIEIVTGLPVPVVIVMVPAPVAVSVELAKPADAIDSAWARLATLMEYDPPVVAFELVAVSAFSFDDVTPHLANMLLESRSEKDYGCERGAPVSPNSSVFNLSESVESFVFKL